MSQIFNFERKTDNDKTNYTWVYEHEWMESFLTLQFITFEPCENRQSPNENEHLFIWFSQISFIACLGWNFASTNICEANGIICKKSSLYHKLFHKLSRKAWHRKFLFAKFDCAVILAHLRYCPNQKSGSRENSSRFFMWDGRFHWDLLY